MCAVSSLSIECDFRRGPSSVMCGIAIRCSGCGLFRRLGRRTASGMWLRAGVGRRFWSRVLHGLTLDIHRRGFGLIAGFQPGAATQLCVRSARHIDLLHVSRDHQTGMQDERSWSEVLILAPTVRHALRLWRDAAAAPAPMAATAAKATSTGLRYRLPCRKPPSIPPGGWDGAKRLPLLRSTRGALRK